MATISTTIMLKDKVSESLIKIERNIGKTKRSFEHLGLKILYATHAVHLLARAFGHLKDALVEPIRESAKFELLLSRMTVALGNGKQAYSEFSKAIDFAKKTPFNTDDVVQAYILLKNAGVETEHIFDTIKMIGDTAQGNNTKFQKLIYNYSQIMTKGVATELDLREFANQLVPISKVLEDMRASGEFPDKLAKAHYVTEAFRRLTKEGGLFFDAMKLGYLTLEGKTNRFVETLDLVKKAFGDVYLNANKFLVDLSTDTLDKIEAFIKNNHKAIVEISRTLSFILIISTAILAVWGVFWLMTHIKTTLIIMTIGVIIKFIHKLFNNASGGIISVLGLIGSVVGVIVTIFQTIFNFIHNIVGTIWNLVTGLVEFFEMLAQLWYAIFNGGFRKAFGLFKLWLLNMYESVARLFVTILSPIFQLVDFLFNGNVNKRFGEWINGFQEKKKKIRDEYGISTPTSMEHLGSSGVFTNATKGYMLGKSFESKLMGKLTTIDDYLKGINTNTKKTATGITKDELSLDDDYRNLLIELAKYDYDWRYSGLKPVTQVINMHTVNISSEGDVDNVVEYFTRRLMELAGGSNIYHGEADW